MVNRKGRSRGKRKEKWGYLEGSVQRKAGCMARCDGRDSGRADADATTLMVIDARGRVSPLFAKEVEISTTDLYASRQQVLFLCLRSQNDNMQDQWLNPHHSPLRLRGRGVPSTETSDPGLTERQAAVN